MDAKPQRPRTVRVHGDENLAPAIAPKKTLHQRNKSTPALSAMSTAGGLKAAAKRTAFGDVSNTKNIYPAKDDSSVPGKVSIEVKEKTISLPHEKKPTNLLRPAHRPMSVSNLKLAANATNHGHALALKQLPADTQSSAQPAITRKAQSTRNAAVFRDATSSLDASDNKSAKEGQNIAPSAPIHQSLAPRQSKVQSSLRIEQPVPQTAAASYLHVLDERFENGSDQLPYSATVRSDGVPIDELDETHFYDYSETDDVAKSVSTEKSVEEEETSQEGPEPVLLDEVIPQTEVHHKVDVKSAASPSDEPLPVSEPEEYWDDEAEEEEYEDGYTTARSFRSRGDNTTGGATTVLLPKLNSKVKKELDAAKIFVESLRTPEEIEDESWDTSMVAEYGEEIFEYMKELEMKMLPNPHYMDNQAEIQWSMRSVLMDWLVQVHHRFTLLPETLFLCVNYIDRFLTRKVVSLGKLQLAGATAILIAAKYEEITCPSIQEIVYMVDGGYQAEEILKAERFMLSMLQFELGWPGPMSFLRRISKADDYDLETRTLAKYFLEITIMDERFVGSPPSFLAAGAHCLARIMLKKGDWSQAHVYYSNYTYSQLHQLLCLMVECCEDPQKHHAAVYEKYTDKRFKKASFFVEAEMQRGFRVPKVSKTYTSGHAGGVADYCLQYPRN
ncbi:MAG: hypothetical protein M1819_000621 [Sarea resinae]|nr:MAG: hypothetical protein M1819_000621 [Sarea resinae]